MQQLRVIGVENGSLIVVSTDGERFNLPIDEALHSKLRQNTPVAASAPKVAPREIQAQIRAGLSAEEVAKITGAPLDYIRRFEGPVLAERDHIVRTAQAVPVMTPSDGEPLGQGPTFGQVIAERLTELNASGQRWSSWKEKEGGWVVKLTFAIDHIEHDARWEFDPKKSSLTPSNTEAISLSQQEKLTDGLIPRLRAVAPAADADGARFDSAAFTRQELGQEAEPEPALRAPQSQTSSPGTDEAAVNHTEDLLEALRRRRGEREAAALGEPSPDPRSAHPSTGSIRVIDVPLDTLGGDEPQQPTRPKPVKKGRTSMPSWDDIVFGAKSDDDL